MGKEQECGERGDEEVGGEEGYGWGCVAPE